MTNDDFKRLLEEVAKPLQQSIDALRKVQEEIRKDLEEVRNTQETRVLPPLVYVETTVKSYADQYVANEDHIARLDKRLHTVEESLGIQPPQELTMPSV